MTVLIDGERSYRNGRNAFWYETLRKSLADAELQVDEDAIYQESDRRYDVRSKRTRNLVPVKILPYKSWVVTATGDADAHFDAVFGERDLPELPHSVKELPTEHFEDAPSVYAYQAYNREVAAGLLRYVRAAHPGAEIKLAFV